MQVENSSKDMQTPYILGNLVLKNRFVMASLTRCRADPKSQIPNELMEEYYEQRSNFGLIITECAPICLDTSNAYPGTGGILNQDQIEGWKKIVDKVHQKGSKIILQLYHSGRAIAQELLGKDKIALSSSSNAIPEPHMMFKSPHPVPKEMTLEEIQLTIKQFRKAAENAKLAGFDGVQLHASGGFLIDQFIRDGTNKRTDNYGGSFENRSRFLFEIIDALTRVYPSNRISVRLYPTGRFQDMYDSNPIELMKYLLGELSKKDLHFVEIKRHSAYEIGKPSEQDSTKDDRGRTLPQLQIPGFFETLRGFYQGNLMGNDGITPENAQQMINDGHLDLVSFGSLAIANPDLPQRVAQKKEFNKMDFSTFFQGGSKGYSDYPTL